MAGVKRPAVIEDGLCFPVTGEKDGKPERSTSVTGKNILAAALNAVNPEYASKVKNERSWRFKYTRHFVKSVELSCDTPEAALKVATAGLDYMYDNFEFLRDGKAVPFRKALETFDGSFATGFVKGTKPKPKSFELEVPYNGKVLKGDSLHQQLDKWVRQGTIEMSCGASIAQVANSDWLDLSDQYFVLLGAGAAMGPLPILLALGANVIAIDIAVPRVWERLLKLAEDSCGTLTFPLPVGYSQAKKSMQELSAVAGCNLFTQTPEVKNWLLSAYPEKSLCVGGYAYIPGEQFPRVALAMDAIIKYLTEQRKASVAFLCTPTDCHLVPPGAYQGAKENAAKAPLWQKLLNPLSLGKMCQPNARRPVKTAAGTNLYVCDALVSAQGPNYALAKRMQHWRAMLARAGGSIISSNVAPSTKTVSVMQNKNFARAYEALPSFRPYEVPGPETSNAVMTALLIHDLREPMHAGHPNMPLANPQQIFSQGSFHGGAWRCAYTFESISIPAVLLYYLREVLVKYYLFAYNVAQTLGWGYMLFQGVSHLASGSSATLWSAFGGSMWLFTMLQSLEVLHSLLGMVRSPWSTTALQIASRIAVVNIVEPAAELHSIWPLLLIFFAWGITETVRYTWYAINVVSTPPAAHTWLRYSTFLPLYPLGVSGELLIFYAALPYLATVSIGGVSLAAVTRYFVFPAYVPGLPLLYTYMLAQRKKALASLSTKSKKD